MSAETPPPVGLTEVAHGLFAPAPAERSRIGVEIEFHVASDERCPRPVAPPVVLAALAADRRFVERAAVSFEPGGQLELSPRPADSVDEVLTGVESLVARAHELAGAAGLQLAATGTNPWHSCADIPLQTPASRYLVMPAMLGPAGPEMMRLTASLQICVDLLPGSDGCEQWLVANLASPVLAAVFANSPTVGKRSAGLVGARTAIWDRLDRRRTGYDGRHLDPLDPVGAYARFLAGAPRFPLAEAEDDRYHAGTVFPPVRPRGGYLELRSIDALPMPRLAEAVRLAVTLLTDERARRDALDLLLPTLDHFEGSWTEAARGRSPLADDLVAVADPERVG